VTNLNSTLAAYNETVFLEDQVLVEDVHQKCKKQKVLSAAIDRRSLSELKSQSPSISDLAHLESVSAPHCADWLATPPPTGQGLRLEANEVQALIKLRLALPVHPSNVSCPLCPGKSLDRFGHHALTCKRGADVCHHHNRLRDKVHDMCRRALLNPMLEQGAGLGHMGLLTRPADILIPVWSLDRAAAIDLTVVHPLNPDNIDGASTSAEHCLIDAERRKHAFNDPKCEELGWTCLPMVTSTYGAWGKEAQTALSRLASRTAMQSLQLPSQVLKDNYQRLAIVLARYTVRALLSRSPASSDCP
jgi:hypothetical protein